MAVPAIGPRLTLKQELQGPERASLALFCAFLTDQPEVMHGIIMSYDSTYDIQAAADRPPADHSIHTMGLHILGHALDMGRDPTKGLVLDWDLDHRITSAEEGMPEGEDVRWTRLAALTGALAIDKDRAGITMQSWPAAAGGQMAA
jgi:hypothetical protein